MYKARQNKEKVSRRIDISDRAKQRVMMRDGKKYIFSNDVIQCKLYMGSIALLDPAIILYRIEKEVDFLQKPNNLEMFCQELYLTYCGNDKNMTIKIVADTIKRLYPNKSISEIDISKVIAELNKIDSAIINQEIRENRIRADTRLSEQEQENYLNGECKKEDVERLRQQWYIKNMDESDYELKQGTYFNSQYGEVSNFRTEDDLQEILFATDGELCNLFTNLYDKLMNMCEQLMASWYFNQADEDTILDSGELKSRALLLGNGKTMSSDVNNRTNDYFYFFIEHQDSPINIYTRFIWPTPPEETGGDIIRNSVALTDGTGRRIRIPLTKIVKTFPIIMGGDLTNDRQEVDSEKFGLQQNITHQKLISSFKDDRNYLYNILYKFVVFIVNRIFIAKNAGKDCKIYVNNLNELKGNILWEYINRYIAKPQLMVPKRVSLGMKDITMDSSPKVG